MELVSRSLDQNSKRYKFLKFELELNRNKENKRII
jgi:hypothetical protein